MISLEGPVGEEGIFFLHMNSGPDNRLSPKFIKDYMSALDKVEKYAETQQNCALVTVSDCPNFFSNGLDLEYLAKSMDKWYLCDHVLPLFIRLFELPVITIAEISGHAFAGGFLLALCHDYRVFVDNNRSSLSMNEIMIPAALHPGMSAILRAKLPPATLHSLVMNAQRYKGQEAKNCFLVDKISSQNEIRHDVTALAKQVSGKAAIAGEILKELRLGLYPEVMKSLKIRTPLEFQKFMEKNKL